MINYLLFCVGLIIVGVLVVKWLKVVFRHSFVGVALPAKNDVIVRAAVDKSLRKWRIKYRALIVRKVLAWKNGCRLIRTRIDRC